MSLKHAFRRRHALILGSSMLALSTGQAVAASLDDITISGFIRQEIAGRISGAENEFNSQTNPFNNVPVKNFSTADVHTRHVVTRENSLNFFQTRLEVQMDAPITSELKFHAKVRGMYDYNLYEDNSDPSFYETRIHGGQRGQYLELSDKRYAFDLPAAYLDFNHGPLFIRAGNQQIAWGEALFFRVLDVPNGLDLRRHLILDPAAEEFSDKRVSSPAIRVSYQVTDEWEFETFAQLFSPSIVPNPGTPYNLIGDQFTVIDQYGLTDNKVNFGGRIRGQLGALGLQFMAVSRHNPDGVYRWAPAQGANKLPGTAFSFSDTGVYSYKEWYHYAAISRLNARTALNTALLFPGAGGGALHANNDAQAFGILDGFYNLSGTVGPQGTGLRGWLDRYYPYENVFGAAANYVISTEDPSSFWDQLITRVEMSYTPNKAFTDPSLAFDPIRGDEWTLAAVAEKYYRFSDAYPATYMVLQYLHKSESDLFGRHLSGYGGSDYNSSMGVKGGYNAVAFAVQQPSPTLAWRYDFTILADIRGGFMIQPGVKWKPNEAWQVDLYASLITAADNNKNALSTVDYADEVFLRVSRQF